MGRNTINNIMFIAVAYGCIGWLSLAPSHADPRVKKATQHYLEGSRELKAGEFGAAIRSFNKAYRSLPAHPHFNCHRAQFLNYIGNAEERLRKPYDAMRSYYRAAYQSACKTPATRNYAASRYNSLYQRWMSSIQIETTPPNARVIQLATGGDQALGSTPFKKVFSPGEYRFKLRLYDHQTVFVNISLRPGMHLKREYKLVKGDDPVNRPEKVDVAPPPPVAGNDPSANPNATTVPEKRDTGSALVGKSVKDTEVAGLDPSGDLTSLTGQRRNQVKPGPPVYKQVWFWAVIGTVAAAAIVIPIAIPKEQKVLVNQGRMF